MRDIKFRGLRTDGYGWVYGYYIAYAVTGGGKLYHHIKNPSDTFDVIPDTIGQYTGLKDKNGVEIYEGDIMELYSGIIFIVEFIVSNITCSFMLKRMDKLDYFVGLSKHIGTYSNIIGNIHQKQKDNG